jgi:hypothetical protein
MRIGSRGTAKKTARPGKLYFSDELSGSERGLRARRAAKAAQSRNRLTERNRLRFSNTRYTDRFLGKHPEDEFSDE